MAPYLQNDSNSPVGESISFPYNGKTANDSSGHSMSQHTMKNGEDITTKFERFTIKEEPAFSRRKLRIVCIGAGYSGLTLAHKIMHEKKLEDVIDLMIYEKNKDVGGTWYENKYPGAACDIPSHSYTFLFEPNPDWSQFYSPAPEIQAYIKRTVCKYNLDKPVQFNSKVLDTIWDEESGKWKIKVDVNGAIREDEADVLVNGAGFLNKSKWPRIPGLFDFKGKLVHTAKWDNSYDYEGKKVAVIGNGSSGIQCVSAMQPKASKLVNYVRNNTWISVNFCADKARNGKNFAYSAEERKQFRESPETLYALRRELEASVNAFFFGMCTDHPFQQGLEGACRAQMKEILKSNPDLANRLIPTSHPGCRRLTPGDGYLEALTQPNCSISFSSITQVTPKGIQTAEGESEFDMIVCATGFDTSFIPSWKLIGRSGATLEQKWKADPAAFFSVVVDDMPNYFMFNGPNAVISHGSVLTQVSWTCDYILRWAKKIATENIHSVAVKSDAVRDFNEYSQAFLPRTTWADKCVSWYKNGKSEGTVTGVYAGSILHFKDALETVAAAGENFDIRWRKGNRFSCLGNGQSMRDENGMGDLAWYM